MKNSISIENGKVTSYETHVANIVGNELQVFGKYSQTTTRHLKQVAKEYGLKIVMISNEKQSFRKLGVGEFK